MVNRLSVVLHRMKTSVDLEIRKWVTPAANPLRYEKDSPLPPSVVYAGYTQHTVLAMLAGDAAVGLWNLIQMPHRGLLTIPVYTRSEPHIYFGAIAENDLHVTQGRFAGGWRRRVNRRSASAPRRPRAAWAIVMQWMERSR